MNSPQPAPKTKTLGQKAIRGAFWGIGLRWLSRFMGLASMVVIARLLTPADFGVIAVTTAIIGLMDAFTDLGADTALIRHPKPERKHYDTVWTFTILIHTLSACLIVVAGFFSYKFYNDPRYEMVLYAMGATLFVSGLTNIGIADFRRNLDYHKDFQINVLVQVIGVISTVALAFWLRSYWALVFGGFVRMLAKLLLSYLMHSYRPRFSLSARKEMLGFSFWIMVRSVAMFLTNKADRLILAVYFSPALLGLYAISGELASMAVFELLYPLGRALLPALATKQDDRAWLESNVKKIFNISATLAMATGVGLAAIAEPALSLVYGAQYTQAAHMLALLAILNAISGFNQPIGQFLLLMNRARDFSLLYIVEGIATLAVVFGLSENHFDFQTILYGRLAVTALAFLRLFYLLKMFKSINFLTILSAWIRPVMAGVGMFFVLDFFQKKYHELPPGILLAVLIAIGALTFASILLMMWFIMRKPPGIEQELTQRIRKPSI